MRPKLIYAAVVVFATFVALAVLNVWYVNRVDRESSREICGIIVIIDDRQQKIESPNPDQKIFIDELHRYRIRLGC